jgi:glutathione S-transferase
MVLTGGLHAVFDSVIACPPAQVWLALEEKGIPYDCVLIELYNKPAWYKELVPTSLVPAVVSWHNEPRTAP